VDNLRDRIARLKQEGLTVLLAAPNIDVHVLDEGAFPMPPRRCTTTNACVTNRWCCDANGSTPR
jgi:hypothetical protein